MPNLEKDIEHAINRYSAESDSNTPDFILAKFMMECLAAFNSATQQRDKRRSNIAAAPGPKCSDGYACMMPDDCERQGKCLASEPVAAQPCGHEFHEHVSKTLDSPVRCQTCGALVTAPSVAQPSEAGQTRQQELLDIAQNIINDLRAERDAAQAQLAKVRQETIEDCAKLCEKWGDDMVEKWSKIGYASMLAAAKSRAWDGLMCAAAIRKLHNGGSNE
jgi:predicted Zn-ribbon and HTH transcriptional regulator